MSSILRGVTCIFGLVAAPFAAHAEILVLRCQYRPMPLAGPGDIKVNFRRDDVFEIDLAAARAKGGSPLARQEGNWARAEIGSTHLRLANGDAWACTRRGGKGEAVVIDRHTGAFDRSFCDGTSRDWQTFHWTGVCRKSSRRF